MARRRKRYRPRRRTLGRRETSQQKRFANCARRVCKGKPRFRRCMS